MYSEQEFSQAIDAVYDFASKLRGTIGDLKSCAETCVANMEDDVIAQNASANLISILDRIEEILDNDVNKLLSDLEEERERADKIARYDEN